MEIDITLCLPRDPETVRIVRDVNLIRIPPVVAV